MVDVEIHIISEPTDENLAMSFLWFAGKSQAMASMTYSSHILWQKMIIENSYESLRN